MRNETVINFDEGKAKRFLEDIWKIGTPMIASLVILDTSKPPN